MRTTIRLFTLGALLLLGTRSAHGQEPQCPAAAAVDSSAVPVIVIARVHADAVVFDSDPDVRVTVNGCELPSDQAVRTSTLPDTIVPGVRYTNVEVSVEYRRLGKTGWQVSATGPGGIQ